MGKQGPRGARHQQLISFVTDRSGHDLRYAVNTDKIDRDIDWRPREPFANGIAKMLAMQCLQEA